ncbi:histone-like nucleoid-structuring protein Lsr2 [Streptomyces sp. NPDC055036]
MALRTIIESDLSGQPDASTYTFGLGDTWYEVDLTVEEQKGLEAELKKYLKVSRKAGRKPARGREVPQTTGEEREEIRDWAKKQNLEVAEFGRIPKTIQKAYDDAHSIDRSKQH